MSAARIRSDGALFWTIVFAAFAATAGALMARTAERLAMDYERERTGYAIATVIAPEGQAGLAAAQAALTHAPHVLRASPLGAERAAALLNRWSGSDLRADELPALRLVEIELAAAPAGADALREIEAALTAAGVEARVAGAPANSAGARLAARVPALAMAAALLFALTMAGLVYQAARGLARQRQDAVAVLADLGVSRGRTAGRVADEAARLALLAGLAGALLAGAVAGGALLLLIPGATLGKLAGMMVPVDYALIAAAPLGAAVAAGAGARAAAERMHAQAARVG